MVKKLRLAGMTFVTLLALGACQALFIGVFPPAAGQATARADLSELVATGSASTFNLITVTANGSEYVLLFSTFGFDPAQAHLVVMDPHLKVLNTFTNSDFLVMAGVYLNGQFAMTDVNDQVVVGNVRFDALPSGFSLFAVNPIVLYSPSVSGKPAFNFNEANFHINGPNFVYNEYGSGWAITSNPLSPILLGTPNPAPQGPMNLSNAFSDQDSGSASHVFVLQDYGSQSTYFLRIPKGDIDADLSTIAAPDVFTYAALHYPKLVVKSDLDSQTVSYSRAGMIAFEHQSESLVRFTLDDPNTVSSMPLKWINGMRVAAGISGTYCVVWDPGTRLLTRYEQWW